MFRISVLVFTLVLLPMSAFAGTLLDGKAHFADDETQALAADLLTAHGGMEPVNQASSLQFNFFTKMLGNPTPFYSFEALDLKTGNAWVEWPFWGATIAWDGNSVWSEKWPMPLPPGFFVRLTSSFLMLPWQLNTAGANVSRIDDVNLPGEEKIYRVLRVTYETQHPGIPGTFYEVFVDPDSSLMAGIRFDINHPGMVANPKQPIGPNYHVFGDYRNFNGLVFPTFYKSFGQGSAEGGKSNAYHFLWNLSMDQPFDRSRLNKPADAVEDTASAEWWQVSNNNQNDETLPGGGK